MSKLRRNVFIFVLSVMLCVSAVCAPLSSLRAFWNAGTNTVSAQDSLAVKEVDNLSLADTTSAFSKDYLNTASGTTLTGEHYVIVSLEGDSILDLSNDAENFLSTKEGQKALSEINRQQSDFIKKLNSARIPYAVKYAYNTVANAVALSVDVKYLDRIAIIAGVKDISVSEYYYAPQDIAVTNYANVWGTGIYKVDPEIAEEYDGSGMFVAVLDTGLDASHRAFRTNPKDKDKLIAKSEIADRIFNGENDKGLVGKNKNVTINDIYYSEKVPFAYDYADNDPDVYPSYSSHGTHVAGIIAGTPLYDADGNEEEIKDQDGNPILDKEGNKMYFTGVAPEAQLAICKVFTDNEDSEKLGGAETVDILAALEDCVKLGVDVINMSLGTSAGFSNPDDDFMTRVYASVRDAGISLMVAASNDYSSAYNGTYGTNLATNPDSATVGSPSTFEGAMSVASINGQKAKYIKVTANGEDKFLYFTEASDGNGNQKDFIKELKEKNPELVNEDGSITLDYQVVPGYGISNNYNNVNVKGKVAVVRRGGEVTFEEKVKVAKQKGAIACVIYNNVSGQIRMSLGNLNDPIPTCSITMDAASNFVSQRRGTFTVSESQKAGPFMSDFSSWGPTPDLRLKPEISAHGGEITSAVPNGWDENSGTSMAAPNMAGAMSLILDYIKKNESVFNPTTTKADKYNDRVSVANRLVMSTATIANDESDVPYSPRKQGAGLADIKKAMTTKAYLYVKGIDKSKIEIGDDPEKTGVYELVFNIKNFSSETRKYILSTETMTETIATDGLTVAERAYMLDALSDITFSGKGVNGTELTLEGNADVEITVRISLGDEAKNYIDKNFLNGMYVEGFVKLQDVTDGDDKVDLNIPWLGFYGDWYAAPMMDISEYDLAAALQDDSIPDEEKPKAAMYATVPLGAYMNKKYIIPLGTYLYELSDDQKKIYSSSDKASLSIYDEKGHYTVNELYAIYAGLLRGAENMSVSITDAVTGEEVFSKNIKNARKAYTGGSSTARASFIELEWSPILQGLDNNKQYNFKMEGELASLPGRKYDSSEYSYNKSFAFNFYIDTEAPEIVDYRVRYESYKDDMDITRYTVYLDVDVYDNHYAQSVALCYADYNEMALELLESNVKPVYGTKNSTTTVSIDITDYYETESELYIQVDDYALNARAYRVANFKSFEDSVVYPDTVKITTGDDVVSGDYSKEITIGVNEAKKLDITASPATASSVNLYWHSFDNEIVKVKDGELFGVKPGDVIVKVYGGKNEHSDIWDGILVHVVESTASEPYINRLTLGLIQNSKGAMVNPTNADVDVHPNKQIALEVKTEPWYYNKSIDVRWTSFSTDVATVGERTGIVKTLKEGTATIKGTLFINNKQTIYSVSTTLNVGPEFVVSNGYLREYHGAGGKVTIPKSLNVYYIYEKAFKDNENIVELEISAPCMEIQESAFANMKALKRVIIPHTVNFIYKSAFANCKNLEVIDLRSRYVTFGASCFENCEKLTSINNLVLLNGLKKEDVEILQLEEGKDYEKTTSQLTTVGNYTFRNCKGLSEIDISELRVSGNRAFENCTSLTTITLSKYTAMGDDMFINCSSLSKLIYTDVTAADLDSLTYETSVSPFGNCIISDIECPAGYIERINDVFVLYSDESKTDIIKVGQNAMNFVVPATVEKISANAFSGSKISSVTFQSGSSLKEIGNYAFSGAYIKRITLPASVEKLGVGVFSWCEKLTYADLSEIKITALPAKTFVAAGTVGDDGKEAAVLETVKLPAGLVSIGDSAFENCGLTSIDLSESSVSEIGDSAFASCYYLESVKLGVVSKLGKGVFASYSAKSALSTVSFKDGSTALGTYTFDGQSSLSNVVIPDSLASVKEIGEYVFRNCSRISALPFNPEKVGDGAFDGCSGLRTIDISGVKEVGARAFAGCRYINSELTEVETIGDYAFSNINALTTLRLNNVKTIGKHAFERSGITSVTFGNNVKSIGNYAFARTKIRGTQNIPGSVTEIGEGVFAAVSGITGFTVGANDVYYAEGGMVIKKVSNGLEVLAYAIGNGSQKATLPEGTVRVGASAFEGATGVTEVEFPYSFKAIGNKALFGCSATRYVFGCLTAPVLEAAYLSANDFGTKTDMYAILNDTGDVASEKYYANFKDYVALVLFAGYTNGDGKVVVKGIEDLGLTAVFPENATGFDGRIYKAYFARQELSELIADDSARYSKETIENIPTAADVRALSASDTTTWTLYREKVSVAREAYNLVTSVQRQFVTNANVLIETEAAMRERASEFGENLTEKEIVIIVNPSKMDYVRNETFVADGMVLMLIWSDGSREELTSGYVVDTTDALTENNRTVKISYKGKSGETLSTTINVSVEPPEVESIEFETLPTYRDYVLGDSFNTSGISIRVHYVDGTSEVINVGYTVQNITFVVGENDVVIEYKGKTTSVKVNVTDPNANPDPDDPQPEPPVPAPSDNCHCSVGGGTLIVLVTAIGALCVLVLVRGKRKSNNK